MSDPTQQASTFKSYPPDLEARVLAITKKYQNDKDLQHLFLDLVKYIEEVRREGKGKPSATSSPSKKRKLDATEIPDNDTLDSIADISFSIPQRKKFKLELGGATLRATNQSTGEIEYAVEWSKVDYCVCMPVPEKAQPQYNFCIFTQQSDEQILFTVPGTAIKPEAVSTKDLPISEGEAYKDVTIKMLNKRLKRKVIQPKEKDFVSQLAQAHRKGEKAVHVKAFRGSKDGTYYSTNQ
ncbi:MAG: hypothetical protein Q9228_008010 [Teloschistes exilis]